MLRASGPRLKQEATSQQGLTHGAVTGDGYPVLHAAAYWAPGEGERSETQQTHAEKVCAHPLPLKGKKMVWLSAAAGGQGP